MLKQALPFGLPFGPGLIDKSASWSHNARPCLCTLLPPLTKAGRQGSVVLPQGAPKKHRNTTVENTRIHAYIEIHAYTAGCNQA